MRILIVDDEPLALDALRRILSDIAGVEVVGAAADGEEALEKSQALQPDLMLLDIQMPGLSGLEVARTLADQPRPEVVFVTAFAEFAPDAFGVEAVDYLLKPVRPDRLGEALKRAQRRLELHLVRSALEATPPPAAHPQAAYEAALWIRERDSLVRVDVDQIRRIEAARDYALIHTRTRTHILRISMAELERKLDPALVTRVHRSAFVRLDTIRRVERNGRSLMRLHSEDGAVVDVGVSYAKRVVAALGLDAQDDRRAG